MNNCSRTPYVAVVPIEDGDDGHQEDLPDVRPDGDAPAPLNADAVMDDFRRGIQLEPEQGRKLSLFYQSSGWVAENGADEFEEVDKDRYICAPDEDADDYVLYNYIRDLILDDFDEINKKDVQLRFAVTPNSRPFKKLETQNSLNEYSLVMTRFLRFMVMLLEEPINQVQFPLDLSRAVRTFNEQNDLDSACKLVVEALKVDPRVCSPCDPLSLFVRFCATKDRGDYMKAENVERLIAKVKVCKYYSMRLNFLLALLHGSLLNCPPRIFPTSC